MALQDLTGINSFKQGFTSVRPTLFRITFPKTSAGKPFLPDSFNSHDTDIYIYCKAASLPASTVQEIEVGYMGRKFYEHGDREFDPWDITIYNSQDFAIRSFFEIWMNNQNMHDKNKQIGEKEGGYFKGNFETYYKYQQDFMIEQLDRRNNTIYRYKMIGAFPTKVSEIQTDFTQTNTIEEFTVTLRYQYWHSLDSDETQLTT